MKHFALLIAVFFFSTAYAQRESEKADSEGQEIQRVMNFRSCTVREYIGLLKYQPNNFHIFTVNGTTVPPDWITKKDIPYLMKLITSEEKAYCVVDVISSYLPQDQHSTIGGQAMNLIDSYRFNKPYPDFLYNCDKTDPEMVKEIEEWWEEENN